MKNLTLFQKILQISLPAQTTTSTSSNESKKINLIQLFNLGGLIFVVPLGFKAIFTQDYTIAFPLLIIGVILTLNYYYLKKSSNENIASHIISTLFFLLMAYLVYTGGISHTGPLWVSALPIIFFFLLGLKKGIVYIVLFLLLCSIILFFPFESLLKADYPHDYKVRIILSFLLITILSAIYEYSNTKSFNKMQKLQEELEYSSTRDHLTSLYNRRGYDKNIKIMQHVQGIVLMCDIDHFKKVNDTYGHDAGDFVLKKVAQKIKNILREDDMAVRWGGEEFFIFLPHTSLEGGYLVAEKIRTSIEDLHLSYEGRDITVTLSIGLDEVTPDITLEDAINNADNAMYQAKQAGRNTIIKFTA